MRMYKIFLEEILLFSILWNFEYLLKGLEIFEKFNLISRVYLYFILYILCTILYVRVHSFFNFIENSEIASYFYFFVYDHRLTAN